MMTLQLSLKDCKILAYVRHLQNMKDIKARPSKARTEFPKYSAHPEVQQARYNLLCCMDPIAGFIQKQLLTENSRELLIKEVYQLIST